MFSLLCSPHTGWQDYQDGVKRIPTACITVEDAELMWRIAQRGQRIVVKLAMEAKTLPDADSFNTVAEIKGWQHPEQVSPLPSHTHTHSRLLGLPVHHLCVPDLKRLAHLDFQAKKKTSVGNKRCVQRKHALLLSSSLPLNLSDFQSSLVW